MITEPAQPPAHSDPVTRFHEMLHRFEEAHARHAIDEMRACLHDDALIESIASDGVALGPDETVEAIRLAYADGVYEIGDWQIEEIAPDVVLWWTGARHRLPDQRMRDEKVCRLTVAKDGLMWRVKLFRLRDLALDHLERHGPGLGLGA